MEDKFVFQLLKDTDMKANFELNTRVKFVKMPKCELSNKTGVILGTSMLDIHDFYIVMLDEPLPNRRAVVIIETCLEAI